MKTADWHGWVANHGSVPLRAVDAALIEAAMKALATTGRKREVNGKQVTTRSPQSVRHHLMALSFALSYARRMKWMSENPIKDITVPPVAPGRIRWLNEDQRKALVKARESSTHPDLALIVAIALHSGARLGEILALRHGLIDAKQGAAFLPTSKTGEPRVIPLSAANLKAIHSRVRVLHDDRVFLGIQDASGRMVLHRAWCVTRKSAGHLPGNHGVAAPPDRPIFP